ncbi:hypothetical protein FVE85_8493 [Porphyridium purpureum]|uniref:Outer membrane lipoprotein BamD-like domain-containing protein n=1 Tax=Porphyridium purpureum TaxID=35688 RepID=A0A5J4YKK5_PORPP|nr:hypothetical protein FVE85_8493 [Porphyridium purpureum]|eukprot:POR0910..scf244_11
MRQMPGEESKSGYELGDTLRAEKTLEQELDEIEAMATNKSPENEGKVYMFGAWLDEQTAGRKVMKSSAGPRGSSDSIEEIEQRSFQRGVDLYNRGRYRESVGLFRAVIENVGTGSRFGGEAGLWLAQAYDALGDKPAARQLLGTLKVHPDKDVKKVADELLYILQAPKLLLDETSLIQIGELSEELHNKPKAKSKMSRGYGTGKAAYAVMEKGPEKYSVEWFLAQRTPKQETSDNKMAVLVIGSCALMLVILFGSRL